MKRTTSSANEKSILTGYATVNWLFTASVKNTKTILENFVHDNTVGLMDEARTGETIY